MIKRNGNPDVTGLRRCYQINNNLNKSDKRKRIISIIWLVILLNGVLLSSLLAFTEDEITRIEWQAGKALQHGEQLWKQGKYQSAIDSFKFSLKKYKEIDTPELPKTQRINQLYTYLSIAYEKVENYEQAIEMYKKRIALNPKKSIPVYKLAKLYLKLGKRNEAIKVLKQYDQLYDDYSIKKKLAEIYEKAKEDTTAIQYYEQAFALKNTKVSILEKIALLYHKIGNDTKAIKAYEDFIKTKPNELTLRKVYHNLGVFYKNIGKEDKAIEAFKSSLSLKFQKEDGLTVAQIYYEKGKYKEARDYLQQVLNIDPNNAPAHYYLGLIYRKEGKLTESISEFEKVKNNKQLEKNAKEQIKSIKESQ